MKYCIYCRSKNFETLFEKKNWSVVKCLRCDLIRTRGIKRPISYEDYHRDREYRENEEMFRNIFRKRFGLIKKLVQSGKIIEIGCSTGVLLELFQQKGWEVWGVEPSKNAKHAKKRGLKVVNSTFEKARLPKNYFDVVVLNHTLEHMQNPVKILRKAKTILKESGIIYIDVPNFASMASKIRRKNWKYLLPEEHIHHFTQMTLEKIIKKAGFEIVWSKSWSGLFDYANPFLELWLAFTGLKKRFFTDLFTVPYALLATFLNMGDSMSMVGRKR